MQDLRNKPHPRVVGAAIAVMVLSLAGLGAITGLLPMASSQKADAALVMVEARVGKPAAARVANPAPCATCGTVEAVRTYELKGDATGAFTGHEVQKNMGKRRVWRVTVRMDDGSFRTFPHTEAPPVAPGDKVKIVDGAVVPS